MRHMLHKKKRAKRLFTIASRRKLVEKILTMEEKKKNEGNALENSSPRAVTTNLILD